jgi:hypothetical protein
MFIKHLSLSLHAINVVQAVKYGPGNSASESPRESIISRQSIRGGRGLAYSTPNYVEVALSASSKFTWAYNWAQSSGGIPSDITYVPMLSCTGSQYTSNWYSLAQAAIAAGSTTVLSFNEPDNAGGCGISVSSAVAYHIQYMNPLASSVAIGSPSVTSSSASGQGVSYLQQWISVCGSSCKYDFCCGHWYGEGGSAGVTEFLAYAQELYVACGKPVWITEFGATSGDEDTFLELALEALESSEYSFVEGYAYYYLGPGYLMDDGGTLSELGEIYATY